MSKKPPGRSPFALVALALDEDFQEIERIRADLDHVVIHSDAGLERARLLLGRFSQCSTRITDGVQNLSRTLDEARIRTESAARAVVEKAHQVEIRQAEVETLLQRFHSLSAMVAKVTEVVGQLHLSSPRALSEQDKAVLSDRIPEVQKSLQILIQEARAIQDAALSANLKALQRNSDSLRQSLGAVCRKLEAALASLPTPADASPAPPAAPPDP